ncbi:MAG: PKD domain-containing protein [Candidatus Riflebacteria bacterium]|nr:PKD domain-containing protein [Candidatus Riflebacteria bacterium]
MGLVAVLVAMLAGPVQAQFTCPGGLGVPARWGVSGSYKTVSLAEKLRWGAGAGVEVTWSFVESAYVEDETQAGGGVETVNPVIDGQGQFPIDARAQCQLAFDTWQRVASIRFHQVADGPGSQIRVGSHTIAGSTIGHGFYPGDSGVAGDIHMEPSLNGSQWSSHQWFVTFSHELGHAIGLKHIVVDPSYPNVLMYAVSSGAETGPIAKDAVCVQDLYGPPLPALSSVVEVGTNLRANFSYPTDPASPSDPTAAYLGTIADLTPGNQYSDSVVTIDPGTVAHALTSLEVRSTALAVQTLSDGAEDGETRLFDETAGDGVKSATDTLWQRLTTQVKTGAKAYRISDDNYQYIGSYSLPLLSPVEATASTHLRFQRAYLLHDVNNQTLQYRVSADGGQTYTILQTETGSSSYSSANSGFAQRDFNLGSYAGQTISVDFLANEMGSYWSGGGSTIDDIQLVDVLAETGSPTLHTTLSPTATTYDLAGLAVGSYNIRLRAVFTSPVAQQPLSQAAKGVRVTPVQVNHPPVAAATGPSSVVQNTAVTLDASTSTDQDGDTLSYNWTQTAGTSVTLSSLTAHNPSFTPVTPDTYTFQVTVSDGRGGTDQATVTVTVTAPPNRAPVAAAVGPTSVVQNTAVMLDASTSTDQDGDTLSYNWTQTAGTLVTLSSLTAHNPSFTPTTPGTYTFQVTVSDGRGGTNQATVTVTVTAPLNHAPVAAATGPTEAAQGNTVLLDASSSTDPDGDTLSYSWSQTDGTSVTLSSLTAHNPTFTPAALGTYTFQVIVSDGRGGTDQATVTVSVTACAGSLVRAVPLSPGLNVIGIPLQPCGRTFTAADLLGRTQSAFVARTFSASGTARGCFEVYVRGQSGSGFTLDGAHGYVLAVPSATTLTFTGEVWP